MVSEFFCQTYCYLKVNQQRIKIKIIYILVVLNRKLLQEKLVIFGEISKTLGTHLMSVNETIINQPVS